MSNKTFYNPIEARNIKIAEISNELKEAIQLAEDLIKCRITIRAATEIIELIKTRNPDLFLPSPPNKSL